VLLEPSTPPRQPGTNVEGGEVEVGHPRVAGKCQPAADGGPGHLPPTSDQTDVPANRCRQRGGTLYPLIGHNNNNGSGGRWKATTKGGKTGNRQKTQQFFNP